ncbi:helix-turn-helix transcriptional regulator [Thermodesulfobacteriota bacterium]
MEEYLTVKEISERIKYAKQSIYNLIHNDTFVLNTHYIKPSRKKILFIWSEVQQWLQGSNSVFTEDNADDPQNSSNLDPRPVIQQQSRNHFNI